MMPSSTSRFSRSVSTLRAMPRVSWSSSNRHSPVATSRMISSVQRSHLSSHYLAAYRAGLGGNLRLFDGLDQATKRPWRSFPYPARRTSIRPA